MTPERKNDLRTIARSWLGGAGIFLSEALDEIERLQRERDALLREHEAQDRLYRAEDDENFPGESELDLAMQARHAHDEAARVLAEGAKK